MNATLPEPLAPFGVVGVFLIAFLLCVWLLQGACYVSRLEVPSFNKASLVTLAICISGIAVEQMLDLESVGNRQYLSLAISVGLAILIQSLMLNLSLFDSLRVQVTSWLLGMTGGVVLILALVGGTMLLRPNTSSPGTAPAADMQAEYAPVGRPPVASLPGGQYTTQPQQEQVFLPSPASESLETQPRPRLFGR